MVLNALEDISELGFGIETIELGQMGLRMFSLSVRREGIDRTIGGLLTQNILRQRA